MLIATWLEGRRSWSALGRRPDLRLPGELDQPLAVLEWRVTATRLGGGLRPALAAMAFFRFRRARALAAMEFGEPAGDGPGGAYIERLEARLARERERSRCQSGRTGGAWSVGSSIFGQLWRSHRINLPPGTPMTASYSGNDTFRPSARTLPV